MDEALVLFRLLLGMCWLYWLSAAYSALTLQFNSWTQNDHPLLTSLRNIARTCRPGGPPSFL